MTSPLKDRLPAVSGLLLLLTLWLTPWTVRAQTPQRVVALEIQHVGPPAVSDALVRANIRLKVGEPYNRNAVDRSIQSLYRTGYDFKQLFTISEFYDRDRPAFYRAIQSVREHDMDMTAWLEYFVEGLATQMHETVERGKNAIRTDLLVRKHGLNARHAKALGSLLDLDEMHIRDFAQLCPNVNKRTLQRDLQKLEDLSLIARKGAARQSLYILKENPL